MSTLTVKSIAAPVGYDLQMPAGHIVQVVNANYSTHTNVTSTSLVATGLTAAITPSNTSNKVLVQVSLVSRTMGDIAFAVNLYKGGSNLLELAPQIGDDGAATQAIFTYTFSYLDSPSTTSATTYAVFAKSNGGTQIQFHDGGSASTITLMEVAG
jgi:hypothetical protein